MNASTIIEAIVDKHESVYGGDIRYDNAIAYIAKVDLANMDETAVGYAIERFLYGWGNMGRVLGRPEYSGWQVRVTGIIKSNNSILKQFKKMNIETENLSVHETAIIKLFDSFNSKTSPTSSAKILHLICPDFFPLWDNAISDALRVELAELQGYAFDRSISARSSRDYFRFMGGVKLFMSTHNSTISLLSNKYQHNKLRIVDACFLFMVRRPLYLVV